MATKHAVVSQLHGITFVGKTDSSQWIGMDGPAALGGSEAGARPKKLMLLALGGCTGSDIAAILKKKRVDLAGLQINLTAEQRDEHPQVFTSIHMESCSAATASDPRTSSARSIVTRCSTCSVRGR